MRKILLGLISFLLLLFQVSSDLCATELAPSQCGVYSWAASSPQLVNPKKTPDVVGVPLLLVWDKLEPEEGKYDFETQVRERLAKSHSLGYNAFILFWVVPRTPQWIYEKGVPEVKCAPTVNPMGKVRTHSYPYYFDPKYKMYYHRAIRKLGKYVAQLPPELQARILFVQAAEGSTGDGQPYKGKPLNEKYNITKEQWSLFRREAWQVYREAFAKPLVVNSDAFCSEEIDWLFKNCDAFGVKLGMFTHGYHVSGNKTRLTEWRALQKRAKDAGVPLFSRGEQDGEWLHCGWSKQNPREAFYWSGIFAAHCGVDVWNIPHAACSIPELRPGFRFFNRYAGYHKAASAPAAFCALRDGLDVSDADRFPVAEYGKCVRKNQDRYLAIVSAFANQGAVQQDPPKALGGGMMNRQRKGYNDAGWEILDGNYEKFLTQVAPRETSVGLWHVPSEGPSEDAHYGRFARTFHPKSRKKALYFKLASDFFAEKSASAKVRVIYLDRGKAGWSLQYFSQDGEKVTTPPIRCSGSNCWKEKVIAIDGARWKNKKYDIAIVGEKNSKTIFHLVEIMRAEK